MQLDKRLELIESRLANIFRKKIKFLYSLKQGVYTEVEPRAKAWVGCTRQQYCLPDLPFSKKFNSKIISKAIVSLLCDDNYKKKEVIYTQDDLEQLQKEWHLVITEYIKRD